ncbi:hypothetical protein L861_20370 [Litchfieldella anticariensis FP35 = DSM 16096]|uniref:Uncharacterized protein n=1 Tax=Litchfieldella anticariensis (strain DSM 16096 / CECT 5854 / CIP 108499 / LMG 22089 / FP35) TaxID=1121939 RepID=S2KJ72_LITA3|nr:hypothetical protein L861_20370 [Halomonas anticariensis FP35 = DSM 16096]
MPADAGQRGAFREPAVESVVFMAWFVFFYTLAFFSRTADVAAYV